MTRTAIAGVTSLVVALLTGRTAKWVAGSHDHDVKSRRALWHLLGTLGVIPQRSGADPVDVP